MRKIIILLAVAFICTVVTAKTSSDSTVVSKEQTTDKKLSDKLAMAELKLEKVKKQIATQDSIIKLCEDSVKIIDEKIKATTTEQYDFTSSSNKELKALEKKMSKAVDTEKKELEKEYKAKQTESNKKIAEFEKILKALEGKTTKFEATETKVNDKIKTLDTNLKLAEEGVATAKKAIEEPKKLKKK